MKRILLSGASGRMGHELARCAAQGDFTVSFGVDEVRDEASPFPIYPSFSEAKGEADVLIDFSRPALLKGALAYALTHGLPMVLAATGYTADDLSLIREAAKTLPIFQSANLSLGVYVLKVLAQQAKKLLEGFDIEIVEAHHKNKQDAPSGTALMLLDALKTPDTAIAYGRTPESGKRGENEIGVHAVRGGTLFGEHEVLFLGQDETITLTHSAQSRAIFAFGALKAAKFVLNAPAGLYSMENLM